TPVGQESYRRDLKAACRRAEVPEITPYELRHTAITHQIEAGKDIVEDRQQPTDQLQLLADLAMQPAVLTFLSGLADGHE
ncbi:MAG: hypothetical protein GY925_25415, partial [Actinomycetia bacterium]|nr:hypothetical protein [Actinomycetes bacterium]